MVSYLMPSVRRGPSLPFEHGQTLLPAHTPHILLVSNQLASPKRYKFSATNLRPYKRRGQGRKKMVVGQLDLKRFRTDALFHQTKSHFTVKQAKKRKRRRTYSFDSNQTMARMAESDLVVRLKREGILSSPARLPDHPSIHDMVHDHSYRRVQLFYYLSVIYYKSGCQVAIAKTNIQHGVSKIEGFSAAHSSILTHVTDNFFKLLKIHLQEVGLDQPIRALLIALGVEKESLQDLQDAPLTHEECERLFAGLDQESLIGKKSPFFHNMNATVELPHCVNEFDTVIEDSMRANCLELLNSVSRKELNPYQALLMFVKMIQDFLSSSQAATEAKIQLLDKLEALEKKLWELERGFSKATFSLYLKTLQDIGKCYRRIEKLRPFSLSTNLKGRLTWQKNYFSENVNLSEKNFRRIQSNIKSSSMPYPVPISSLREPLRLSLKIIELQKKFTLPPNQELLSGKKEGDTLVVLTEEELILQKISLIKRA